MQYGGGLGARAAVAAVPRIARHESARKALVYWNEPRR